LIEKIDFNFLIPINFNRMKLKDMNLI